MTTASPVHAHLGRRQRQVLQLVSADPGHTRFWYIQRSNLRLYRMSWAYRPFNTLLAQGLLTSRPGPAGVGLLVYPLDHHEP